MSSLPRADGFADADLAGALRDADQHDVHDADAGREQGDDADDERADADRVRRSGAKAETSVSFE